MAEFDMKDIQNAKDAIAAGEADFTEYMRVVMNSETFLVPVDRVLSILRPVSLTKVPMAPDHLMGVANIRGQVFCVIDPGKTLRLPQKRKEKTRTSRFLLLRHARVHLGIWVEEVLDLHRVVTPEDAKNSRAYEVASVETTLGLLPVLRVDALFD
ncbi:MAG: chemotaxis protein CheW [Ghiorsea sp.]